MKKLRSNGWFAYLEEHQLFGASPEILDTHRKIYHARYMRKYRKKQKTRNLSIFKPEFTVEEKKLLQEIAKGYGMSITRYIRQSVLHCADNAPLLPQLEVMQKIIQLLELIYSRLYEIDILSQQDRVFLQNELRSVERLFVHIYHNPPKG